MSPTESPFFNLPQATLAGGANGASYFGAPKQHSLSTNWKNIEAQDMNRQSLFDLLAGTIPVIRQKDFLSQQECEEMVMILKSHDIV